MEITEVRIIKMENKGKLLAYANVVLNNSIILKGIKVIDGSRGIFIAMPSKRDKTKKLKFREFYHPINSEARSIIEQAILETYEQVISE